MIGKENDACPKYMTDKYQMSVYSDIKKIIQEEILKMAAFHWRQCWRQSKLPKMSYTKSNS